MKIIDLKVRCVAIPLTCQLRHNTGVHPGYFLRTILELITDEGIVGLGEIGGGDQRGALLKLKPRILGMDPFHLEAIKLKVLRSIYYMSNARLYAAIEMACLDVQGKAVGRSLSDLLGGSVRKNIPMIAYLFWRYDRPDGKDDTRAEDLAERCVELHETLGVKAMKLKAGVMEPGEEARVLELCRDQLGPDFGLRIDPNGVWSVPTAVRIGRRLEPLAAMLHTASTIPEMTFAGDAHYHYLTDDIIVGGLMKYEDGCIQVPTGPGLGVELDEEKMEKYERLFEERGDYYARFHQDPKRPDWYPIVGGQ